MHRLVFLLARKPSGGAPLEPIKKRVVAGHCQPETRKHWTARSNPAMGRLNGGRARGLSLRNEWVLCLPFRPDCTTSPSGVPTRQDGICER